MMKHYKAILFDMDGTLLPMDQDIFTTGYFRFLAKKLLPYGIDKEKLVPAIWASTGAMVKNDGHETNDRVFWKHFEAITGVSEEKIGAACIDFYTNEFQQARGLTEENPYAREAVELAHKKAPIVALATNPLFPMCGQITRMSWMNLSPDDFDLVTSYETDCYCKPNPAYFLSVCDRLGVSPGECLLIGNDEDEDMYAGSQAGLDCYLVTDSMISSKKRPWDGPRGSFQDLLIMLNSL